MGNKAEKLILTAGELEDGLGQGCSNREMMQSFKRKLAVTLVEDFIMDLGAEVKTAL